MLCRIYNRLCEDKIHVSFKNKKNKYFLERISPYNVTIGQFEKEEDVINTIKIDISKFENAKNSNKFNKFINTGKDFVDIVKSLKIFIYIIMFQNMI